VKVRIGAPHFLDEVFTPGKRKQEKEEADNQYKE
jgi:hypothetical protein